MGRTDVPSDIEVWLDSLDPNDEPGRDARHLRRIAEALQGVEDAEQELREAVAAARRAGDSWATIGMVLGVSRQAAYQRFASSSR